MSWREHLGPASFRGFSFEVYSSECTGGRTNAIHNFPFSENPPFVEDLGALGRTFPVEGFFVGENYLDARDALQAKLEQPGPGDLVHPTYGRRTVKVGTYRFRETTRAKGMCEISIEFIETTAEVLNPTSAVSGAGLVASAVDTSHAVSLAVFLSEYTRLPYSIEMHAALTSLRATVDAVLSANALGDQDLATLLQESRSLTEDATVLLDAPQMLADKVQSIATGLKSALQSAKSLSPVSTLLRLATWVGGTRPDASTPSGAAKAANFYAVVKYTQKEGIGQAAQTVAESKYASYDDAVSAREQVTAQIDAQVERADDVGFASQTELRASLVQAVPGPDSDLPHIEKITRGSDTPSIVLAYEVYGDATREQEIVDRNKIKDPTYVPGGASIEVLSK